MPARLKVGLPEIPPGYILEWLECPGGAASDPGTTSRGGSARRIATERSRGKRLFNGKDEGSCGSVGTAAPTT
jgi:hypothetical protein